MLRATFFPLPLQFQLQNFCHRPNPNPNPTTISSAYRRVPLDTPDAYRLVDDYDDSTDFPSQPPTTQPPKSSGFAKLKHTHKVRSLLLSRNKPHKIEQNALNGDKGSNFGDDPQHFSEDNLTKNVAFGRKTPKDSNFGDDPQRYSLENPVKTAAFGQKTRKNTNFFPKGSNFAGILGDPQDYSEEVPVKSEAFGRKTRKNTKSSAKGSNFVDIVGSPQDYSDGFSNFGGEFKEKATRGGSFYRKTNKNTTNATQSDTFDRKTNRRNTNGAIDSNFDRIIGDQLDSSDDEGFDQDSDFGGQSENQPRKERGRGWGDSRDRFQEEPVKYPKRKKSAFSKASQGGGFFSKKSFKELGCSEDMLGALRELDFLRPSNIQAMAYGPILEGKTCVVADQSGSGKTLAYLAPTVQCLRQEEVLAAGKPSSKNPRAVILVPTAELASQVLNNCRAISKHGVPFRSMVATGGFRQKTQLESLQEGLDVLIATPGRFLYLCKEGFLDLSSLRSVVLDEVDILFGDEEFKDVLKSLISSAPVSTQYLFVTATLPVDIYNKLVEVFPDCEMIMGPGMHRTSSRLEEVLVDCSGDREEKTSDSAFNNKKSALLQILESDSVAKTIVFCNKIETCRKIENILKRTDRKEHQVRVLPFHAAIEQQSRNSNMKEFLNLDSNESLFLICTDRASRGIDFTNVDHVILFDFPREPSEYVRRVGRTARGAGGKGKAYVFAVGKQVSLARRIIERNQKGHPLHNVPSAYELEGSMF